MPIYAANLKLLRAAVMDSANPLNGGLPSAHEITDGESNQLFEDVSELQRAGGSVEFAKLYGAVQTASADVLRGANFIISDPPTDPATSVVMFAAASVGETQADVIERIGGVSGTISSDTLSKVNPAAYAIQVQPNGPGLYMGDPLHAVPHGVVSFSVTQALYGIASTAFPVGAPLTLVEFYDGKVIKSEAHTVLEVQALPPAPVWDSTGVVGYRYTLKIALGEASSYAAFGAAPDYSTVLIGRGETLYGTYLINATTLALRDFAYYGVSRLTAPAEVGDTVMAVETTTAPVIPTALVDAVSAETVLGFEPRLLSRAPDGREPIFQAGRYVVVGKDVTHGPSNYTAGSTITLAEALLKRVKIIGADGRRIDTGWTADLDAGTVTIASVVGWSLPARIVARAEDMALISSVGTNAVTIGKGLSRAYPTGSSVSAALVVGDLRARVSVLFDQQTWSGEWKDTLIGSPASAQYNAAAYPIALTNDGAITERWRIVFASPTAFVVSGESVGQIAVGDTTSACAPINPATGRPYFTIPALGWGSGWSAANVLRFNTTGAMPPAWVLRCVQQSAETTASDSFEIAFRGGVNRP